MFFSPLPPVLTPSTFTRVCQPLLHGFNYGRAPTPAVPADFILLFHSNFCRGMIFCLFDRLVGTVVQPRAGEDHPMDRSR